MASRGPESAMKSDRMPEQGESLQLLVDPMCNLFAGLVLLSVFLALFAGRQSGDPRVSAGTVSRFANEEILQRRLRETDEEIQLVEKNNKDLGEKTSAISSRPPLEAVEKALAEVDRGKPSDASFSVEDLQRALEAERDKIRERDLALANEMEGLKQERTRLGERWEKLSRTAPQASGEGGEIRVRLPRARPTEKIPLYLLIAGGRLFPAQLPGGAEDEEHVERQRSPSEDRVLPRPHRGLSSDQEVEDYLRQIDSGQCYPVLVVYADSFPEYQKIRRVLEKMNLGFGWEPRESGAPLRLSARGFKPEAQ